MGRRYYNPKVAPSTEADKENKVTENIEIAQPVDKNNEKSENEPNPQKVAKEQKHCKYFWYLVKYYNFQTFLRLNP